MNRKSFTRLSPPATVMLRDIASVLQSIRSSHDVLQELVAPKLLHLVKRESAKRKNGASELMELLERRGIEAIETPAPEAVVRLQFDDLTMLADAYGVHRLLLDSLISETVDDICDVQAFQEFISVGDGRAADYGNRADYRIPARRLSDTGHIAIVDLAIEPRGRSGIHSHAGDEFIFVRRGEIEIRLGSQGVKARLNSGDYIHFYAEQEHSAVNVGDANAELFIIRLQPATCRLNLYDTVRSLSTNCNTARTTASSHASAIVLAVRELASHIIPAAEPSGGPFGNDWKSRPVADKRGLGRFLLQWTNYQKDGSRSLDELARVGAQKGFNRSKLHRVHHGRVPLDGNDLIAIADIYGIQLMLLVDFLVPAASSAVIIRQSSEPGIPLKTFEDWREVPAEELPSGKAWYSVPRMRLAEADTSIALLRLDAGGETPDNRHPGHEIVLALKGQIEIRFGTTRTLLDASKGVCAQFNSGKRHRLVNVGEGTAQALVVRVSR